MGKNGYHILWGKGMKIDMTIFVFIRKSWGSWRKSRDWTPQWSWRGGGSRVQDSWRDTQGCSENGTLRLRFLRWKSTNWTRIWVEGWERTAMVSLEVKLLERSSGLWGQIYGQMIQDGAIAKGYDKLGRKGGREDVEPGPQLLKKWMKWLGAG